MSDKPRIPLFVVKDLVTARGSPWTPPQRLVALAIADHMNQTGECWPSARALATWTGLHRLTVLKIIESLSGDGPLAIFDLDRGGSRRGSKRTSNVYHLKATLPVVRNDQSPGTTGNQERPVVHGNLTGRPERPLLVVHGYTEGPIEGPKKGPVSGAPRPAKKKDGNGNGQRRQDGTATAWSKEAADVWRAAYRGDPPGQFFRHLKPIVTKYSWLRVRPVLRHYLKETQVEYVNIPKVLGGSFEALEASTRRSSPQGPRDETENDRRILAALLDGKRRRQLEETAAAAAAVKGAGLSLVLPTMEGTGR
jgi:hypothetical protein